MKSYLKVLIAIVVIFVLLIVAGGIASLYVKTAKTTSPTATSQPTPTPYVASTSTQPTAPTNEISVTYSGEKLLGTSVTSIALNITITNNGYDSFDTTYAYNSFYVIVNNIEYSPIYEATPAYDSNWNYVTLLNGESSYCGFIIFPNIPNPVNQFTMGYNQSSTTQQYNVVFSQQEIATNNLVATPIPSESSPSILVTYTLNPSGNIVMVNNITVTNNGYSRFQPIYYNFYLEVNNVEYSPYSSLAAVWNDAIVLNGGSSNCGFMEFIFVGSPNPNSSYTLGYDQSYSLQNYNIVFQQTG